ncbi:glycosyltransferase family 2 protein [Aequorivita echinoideorum]|uniref:Glycosyltransferase family 2 protein n=1 Tax=Aequorivita echinoideorum TaxID=1549647 RepID=A0ABS5S5F8_9FLAO|nr:glycosyltransferase family 2 protein [Aequorivita echinoideorum]MBT0608447.1 glycosyltransferase family 2 protein [Aequorivita echinoideorum]
MVSDVCVIIPVYNRENFILETLKSVSDQTYKNWFCIVVDDGSTDKTSTVVEQFICDDKRFTFIKRPKDRKKGASTCRNIGLENTSSKYVQFLDADDVISKNKIEEQFKLMDKNSRSIATCLWGRFESEKFDLYENLDSYQSFENPIDFLNSLITSKGYFPPHSYLIPRKIIQSAGYWNESISLNDDGEFMMRILANTEKIVFAKDAIAWYRKPTENNLSNFNDIIKVEKAIYSWKLIENNLKIRFGDKANRFVEWSKGRFFINLKNSFPDLINDHTNFFEIQIREDRRSKQLSFRLWIKIKNLTN